MTNFHGFSVTNLAQHIKRYYTPHFVGRVVLVNQSGITLLLAYNLWRWGYGSAIIFWASLLPMIACPLTIIASVCAFRSNLRTAFGKLGQLAVTLSLFLPLLALDTGWLIIVLNALYLYTRLTH